MKDPGYHEQLELLRPNLHAFAYHLTSQHVLAEDLLQDTFLKAIKNQDKFSPGTSLKNWVFTIMRNTFINDYRRKKKRQTIFTDFEDQQVLDSKASSHSDNLGDSNMVMEEINYAMAQLPVNLREAFAMNQRGHKYHEIADSFDIPLGTVKTRIHQARKLLRKDLHNLGLNYGLVA